MPFHLASFNRFGDINERRLKLIPLPVDVLFPAGTAIRFKSHNFIGVWKIGTDEGLTINRPLASLRAKYISARERVWNKDVYRHAP